MKNALPLLYIFLTTAALASCKGAPQNTEQDIPQNSSSSIESSESSSSSSSNSVASSSDQSQSSSEPDLLSGECPHSGSITYKFKTNQTWPSGAKEKLTLALDEALWYYNCYADLTHNLTINYKSSVPTAEANVDGLISFGDNQGYMIVATTMHEIGHTMGVGFYPFTELTDSNKHWTGPAVKKVIENIPTEESDPDAAKYITADSQHFWPYGLNYAKEHINEWSLINHVRIVAAMQEDKNNYLSN